MAPSLPPTGDPVRGTVKWFNAEKGFGFVTLEDGADVFLHSSVITRSGMLVNERDQLRCRVGQGMKGRQVTEIIEVEPASGPAPPSSRPMGPRSMGMGGGPPRRSGPVDTSYRRGPSEDMQGTVKWYNQQKGFGFITPDDGSKDIFVHASTLARAGLDQLPDGTRVMAKVVQGQKGPEAVEISLS
jgi:cold shock protein